MERLWSPWRMEYIKDPGREDVCIFCEIPSGADDEAGLILARGDAAFVILNKYPYNTGHLMIVPFRHVGEWEALTAAEHAEIASLTARAMDALKATSGPHGFNLGVNQGRVAGAGVVDHVHMHVVPRWGGDTNFTFTVGGVKVLPEALDDTYAKLKPHFAV
ncbi:MAG TPA: HIT domain-containing protein [Actinomycetota bacterium]